MNDKRKILLIDDDTAGSELITFMLEQRGFDVRYLNDSRKALETIENEYPELVLLDIIMPDVSGVDVLKSLRNKTSLIALPIVMMTTVDNSSEIANCLRLGANDYLTKPVDIEVAVARITTQLKLVDINRENLKKKEIETLNAMIVTYNHEINNPLAIAMACMTTDLKDMTQKDLDTANEAIQRVSDIVRRIEGVTNGTIKVEKYCNTANMIKI